MATPAQPIVFQVSTYTPCAFLVEDPNQKRLLWGAGNESGSILCAALDTELSASSLETRETKGRFSTQAAGCLEAMISKGRTSC
jgi:hypothetical protein